MTRGWRVVLAVLIFLVGMWILAVGVLQEQNDGSPPLDTVHAYPA